MAAMARTASAGVGRCQSVAEGAVADLVVILDERHEGGGRQMRAGFAARLAAIGHHLALEGEAFGEGTSELLGVAAVFSVVAGVLARGRGVQDVVDVVVPLGSVDPRLAAGPTLQPVRLVLLVLQYEMDMALAAERVTDAVRPAPPGDASSLSSMMAWTASSRRPSK